MLFRDSFRDAILERCAFDEKTLAAKLAIIAEYKTKITIANSKHVYNKPIEMVHIKKKYSKDLSLFYTEDDVRSLFNWRKPLYQNICKFMSQ